jgi:murein DD-endopeptidase MepM/ murein hydrolase activator NlpD
MKWVRHPRIRLGFAILTVIAAVAIFVAWLSRSTPGGRPTIITWAVSQSPIAGKAPLTPSPPPDISPAEVSPTVSPMSPESSSSNNDEAPTASASPELIIPVAGVRPEQLHDTFSDARAEGRTHDAIDIPAPLGTPVIAAADGTVLKLFQSDRGGTTIYQLSTDRRFVYYYAHLNRYAEGLTEGQIIRQGETIAYVGDTGNAGAGNYHLHFSVALISDPKKYWQGVNINPYPLLKKK